MTIAPIVLFVYSRPEHTQRTLEALAANALAEQSDLIVYADAARSEREAEAVRAVRELVRAASRFRSVNVIARETNYGLAANIMEGVTEVCSRYGRVIVLEDDIVTSPHFLTFMNSALDRYADESRVWHISGWNVPIGMAKKNRAFAWRMMECWGWATWSDRWNHFTKDTDSLLRTITSKRKYRFNLDGHVDYFSQILSNKKGKINTWAVYWYATIFLRDGLCISPYQSLIANIGLDGSGLHCGSSSSFLKNQLGEPISAWPDVLEEDVETVSRIKRFHRNKNILMMMPLRRFVAWVKSKINEKITAIF
jgi:hypothetical protein